MTPGSGTAATQRQAHVIVASTSAATGAAPDRTGPVLYEWLHERGFTVTGPEIVADGLPVARAAQTAIARQPAVVITTGGTGVAPSDKTPEAITPLLDVELPGLIEELRRRGAATFPNALLTRGVAGFAGNTFVITLPGSPGGVRDGLAVLAPVIDHVIAQRTGEADAAPHPPRT